MILKIGKPSHFISTDLRLYPQRKDTEFSLDKFRVSETYGQLEFIPEERRLHLEVMFQ